MTIIPPVFSAGTVLTNTMLNTAFATLVNEINEHAVQIGALSAPTAPDLTGYVTHVEMTDHNTGAGSHPGYVKAATVPAGKTTFLQTKDVTLDGSGNGTVTWDTAYNFGAMLGAWPDLNNAAAAAVSVSSITTTGAVVKGPASQIVRVFALGWF